METSDVDAHIVGAIREIIQVPNYTYLRVEAYDTTEAWVAVRSAELSLGSRVRVKDGAWMKDFSSPTLKRTFESIYFGVLLEMHDELFRSNSAVVLPEGEAPTSDEDGHVSLTSVGLVATLLRYNEEHAGKKLLVAGHCDTTNTVEFNQKLSEERAGTAHAILTGNRDTFVKLCDGRHDEVDVTQIFDWTTRAYGFTCKPTRLDAAPSNETGLVDGSVPPDTAGRIEAKYTASCVIEMGNGDKAPTRTRRDAAFPVQPELAVVDPADQRMDALRFGIWQALSVEDRQIADLPPSLVDQDDNRFRIRILDKGNVIGQPNPTVVLTSYLYNSPIDFRHVVMSRVAPGVFQSGWLFLVSDLDELMGPAGQHRLHGQMLEARMGGQVEATYPGLLHRMVVTPPAEATRLQVHIFVVAQHIDRGGGPDGMLPKKELAAQATYARAVHVFERMGIRLTALPYTGIAPADSYGPRAFTDGSPLHVVVGPREADVNLLNYAGMGLIAKKYPA